MIHNSIKLNSSKLASLGFQLKKFGLNNEQDRQKKEHDDEKQQDLLLR